MGAMFPLSMLFFSFLFFFFFSSDKFVPLDMNYSLFASPDADITEPD